VRDDAGCIAPSLLPLAFEGVCVSAGGTPILADLALTLEAGPPTLVVGPNGSGKTTLLRLAMGLIEPDAGRLTFGGRPGASSPRRAIVFQRPVMLRRTVAANVAFALAAAHRPADAAAVRALLDRVGLTALADRPARRLSGGEQQRLALARALARDPEVLFLDEPTASLDPAQTKLVEDIIARVAASGVKVVMATHDLGEARRLGGDVVFLVSGRVVEHAPAARFFSTPASEAARRFLAGDLIL
jgi:tungstate transport system ATP-binding protein